MKTRCIIINVAQAIRASKMYQS